jgi:outer membrane protein
MRSRAAAACAVLCLLPGLAAAQDLAFSLAPASVQAPAPSLSARIAFFRADRVFGESAAGKQALGELSALRERWNLRVNERAKLLNAERDSLAKGQGVLSEPALAQARRKVERFEVDMERFLQDAQAEIDARQRELEAAFQKRLAVALEGVAKQKGLHLVFNYGAAGLTWGDPSLDISNDIVAELDRSAKSQ